MPSLYGHFYDGVCELGFESFFATLSYLHMACLHDIHSMSVPSSMFKLDVLVVT